ncbi:MAG: dTDP-4-dehydrorhamnose reductase [Solimonas sp.]
MRILLTGAGGQVGSEVRKRLRDVELLTPLRAEFDLAQPAQLRAVLDALRPDFIINAGAYTAVDRAEDEPELAMTVNGDAVAAIADYCRAAGAPLIQLSTDYVFDGAKPNPYVTDDAAAPAGAYGRSKLAGEAAARTVREHIVLRISWVFAAHGGNFVKTMLKLAQTRPELGVVADQHGGPTWAGHVAEALAMLVAQRRQRGALPAGTYHFCGGPAVSWHAFAEAIFAEAVAQGALPRAPLVRPIPSTAYPTKARRPANSVLDMASTTARLGLAQPAWRDGLRETVAALAAGEG